VTISFQKPLTVMTVLPGTPAQAAHIYPGDKIVKIDGKPVRGMTLPQASALISNGPPGSTVTITIHRDGNHIQRDIKLTRATVCSTTP
jgi:carboxyl-terminal processing protease